MKNKIILEGKIKVITMRIKKSLVDLLKSFSYLLDYTSKEFYISNDEIKKSEIKRDFLYILYEIDTSKFVENSLNN